MRLASSESGTRTLPSYDLCFSWDGCSDSPPLRALLTRSSATVFHTAAVTISSICAASHDEHKVHIRVGAFLCLIPLGIFTPLHTNVATNTGRGSPLLGWTHITGTLYPFDNGCTPSRGHPTRIMPSSVLSSQMDVNLCLGV